MKKVFFSFILLAGIGFSCAVNAQVGQQLKPNSDQQLQPATRNAGTSGQTATLIQVTPEQSAGMQTERMAKALGLSTEVKNKVYAINLRYAKQGQQLSQTTEDREKIKAKSEQLATEREKEYKVILTREQYAKYMEMKTSNSTNTLRNNNTNTIK